MRFIPHHIQILIIGLYLQKAYPPPYERHYKYVKTAQIKNVPASFNWEQALSDSSISKKISVLIKTIIVDYE